MPNAPATIEELRNDARFERERLALYRARIMGPQATSQARLRELEQRDERASARLAHALRAA